MITLFAISVKKGVSHSQLLNVFYLRFLINLEITFTETADMALIVLGMFVSCVFY